MTLRQYALYLTLGIFVAGGIYLLAKDDKESLEELMKPQRGYFIIKNVDIAAPVVISVDAANVTLNVTDAYKKVMSKEIDAIETWTEDDKIIAKAMDYCVYIGSKDNTMIKCFAPKVLIETLKENKKLTYVGESIYKKTCIDGSLTNCTTTTTGLSIDPTIYMKNGGLKKQILGIGD